MRSASRTFAVLGVFGLVAALLLALGYGPTAGGARVQAGVILAAFGLASLYLAIAMRPQGARELDGLHPPADDAHADEEIHLPGPSIWPAAYGVVGAVVLLGLVTRYEILVVGIVLLVLTSVGWARESVKDYRREIAHHKPEPDFPPRAVAAAHRVQEFARAHGGAEAVVQHLGQGKAEIVVVGRDGAWGTIGCSDVADARTAVGLAGVTLHAAWPASLGGTIKPDVDLWQRMAGTEAPMVRPGPRDGTTQVGARIFVGIAVFAAIAATLLVVGYDETAGGARVQGGVILATFMLACGYLFVALRNARGEAGDHRYADAAGVAREPTEPEPPVDLETLHLPGPSIWPAAFSVAGAVLLLGLVTRYEIALAGVALVVICAIGWGIESVREYRATVAGHHGGEHGSSPAH